MLSVAVLEADESGLAELLAGQSEVTVRSANSVADLIILVAAGSFDAILIAPELSDGWPTSVATEVADKLAPALPVVVVCRSSHDLQAISMAVAGRATVLSRGALNRKGLMAIIAGDVAKHRAGPGS